MAAERIKVIQRHISARSNYRPIRNLTAATQSSGIDYRHFQYTLDNPRLTLGQRKFYEENGYIIIPRLIDDDLLEECRAHFVDLCEGRAEKGNMVMMKDISLATTGAKGEYLYNKAQDIVWDDVFSKYINCPELLDYVECFTGPNIKAMHSMLINKPPDSGKMTSIHPLHQDLHYFPFRPADRIVASWTAMERVHFANGCLIVAPGSHKSKLMAHDYPKWENAVNKAYHGIQDQIEYSTINVEMEKGDTVFFHPLLIHGSGVNTTKGFRKAISCHYAACECDYIDVMGTTQQTIAEEVLELGKKKGLIVGDYSDVWKYRSQLVRGHEVTL